MRWFGKSYGAGYEAEAEHVDTPVGLTCRHCGEAIGADDSGVILGGPLRWVSARHYECFFRGIVGGLNHQLGACTCCGGDQPPDPEGMTRREAALRAVEAWARRDRTQVE